jgi:hypothetical protein
MATTRAQNKWRDKHRFVKTQLNVMARRLIHGYLADVARHFGLRGKAEAVSFSAFVAKSLMQQADYNTEAAHLLNIFAETYRRDRELYSPNQGGGDE